MCHWIIIIREYSNLAHCVELVLRCCMRAASIVHRAPSSSFVLDGWEPKTNECPNECKIIVNDRNRDPLTKFSRWLHEIVKQSSSSSATPFSQATMSNFICVWRKSYRNRKMANSAAVLHLFFFCCSAPAEREKERIEHSFLMCYCAFNSALALPKRTFNSRTTHVRPF